MFRERHFTSRHRHSNHKFSSHNFPTFLSPQWPFHSVQLLAPNRVSSGSTHEKTSDVPHSSLSIKILLPILGQVNPSHINPRMSSPVHSYYFLYHKVHVFLDRLWFIQRCVYALLKDRLPKDCCMKLNSRHLTWICKVYFYAEHTRLVSVI